MTVETTADSESHLTDRPTELVLADGDLPALVAICHAARRPSETPRPALLVPARLSGPRRRACERMADALALPIVELRTVDPDPAQGDLNRYLLDAAREAHRLGADRLTWPAQPGGADPGAHVGAVATAIDRAMLVSRLSDLDAADHPLEISAPFADLSDDQIADLAFDCDAPVETCWWWTCDTGGAARERWGPSLRAAGCASIPAGV